MKQFFKFFTICLLIFSTHFSQTSKEFDPVYEINVFEDHNEEVALTRVINNKNADVNATNENGTTALMLTVDSMNNIEFAHTLLERNANPHIKNNKGQTALFMATIKGNTKLVALFIQYGADVNTLTNLKTTSLMIAIQKEKNIQRYNPSKNERIINERIIINKLQEFTNIINLLLDAGADTTIKDHKGKTVFDMASPEALEILNQRTQQAQRERDTTLCNIKLLNPAPTNQRYRCNAMVLKRTLELLGTSNYPTK
jgi:ankyrin repeat protein